MPLVGGLVSATGWFLARQGCERERQEINGYNIIDDIVR